MIQVNTEFVMVTWPSGYGASFRLKLKYQISYRDYLWVKPRGFESLSHQFFCSLERWDRVNIGIFLASPTLQLV